MDWKEFIKPTRWKVIISIVVGILTYFLKTSSHALCKMCRELKYEPWPDIFQSCDCIVGTTLPQFMLDLFYLILIILIPAVIVYLLYSTISYFAKKKD